MDEKVNPMGKGRDAHADVTALVVARLGI